MSDPRLPLTLRDADAQLGASIRRTTQAALDFNCPGTVQIAAHGQTVAMALLLPTPISDDLLLQLANLWLHDRIQPEQN